MDIPRPPWQQRLPFYYGWVIVAIAFVTMAIAVTARTAFSLLLPPLIDEFGWDRGLVAGAFAFGFFVSALVSPLIGRVMDRHGPRVVIGAGVVLLSGGLLTAPMIQAPWQLYLTLGLLAGLGANLMTYVTHSQFLPNWFVRRRGFAISVAFSGVGAGAFVLLPWLQIIIGRDGWRASCSAMGLLVLLVIGPLTLLVRMRPQELGLPPDGVASLVAETGTPKHANIVDPVWTATAWTLGRAIRTARFWWIVLGYFCALFAWYAIQVHQTKYLIEIGFPPLVAAWSLGLVSVIAIPGQIGLGFLSDRFGREWVWTAACAGFAISYLLLIALETNPSSGLLYVMLISQGFLGYGLTSVMGPIAIEIFEGPQFGLIFGTITVGLMAGGAVGPWALGVIHDRTGSYHLGFLLAIGCCAVSCVSIWIAAPRAIRLVPGRLARMSAKF